ncbi:winged helix-turn-helix transcriptional regulator [Nocardia sp. alder85J]|uniref:winged helix-turn-helix transcriptional regulator n=1 Tax=Nocardia sp. alder85J TaxID=2862949 RepID=UPI001CD6DBF2|nr:helix-turn-helix domain-containing protein [Nocardia sp. alder85J]MCX4095380.1 helix-turn-helix domain-containing protein [Nocardia sp. alder85J]
MEEGSKWWYRYLVETIEVADVPAWDVFSVDCPSRQVFDRIGERWTGLVLLALEPGTQRFSELRRRIEGITQKMLTQTLRALERDGIVTRRVYATVPVTVEYTLTPLGRGLCAAVAVLRGWAYAHIGEITTARADYDEAAAERSS